MSESEANVFACVYLNGNHTIMGRLVSDEDNFLELEGVAYPHTDDRRQISFLTGTHFVSGKDFNARIRKEAIAYYTLIPENSDHEIMKKYRRLWFDFADLENLSG